MSIIVYDGILTVEDMLGERELKEWVRRVDGAEENLNASACTQVEEIFKEVFPRVKAKALHDPDLRSELVINISLNLESSKPSVKVTGHVPPTVVSCHSY